MEDSLMVHELKQISQVADAELGVAEELGWAIAILAASVVYLKWESWFIAIGAAIGAYFLTVFRYRKRAAAAEDNYYRSAGLGKYGDVQDRRNT